MLHATAAARPGSPAVGAALATAVGTRDTEPSGDGVIVAGGAGGAAEVARACAEALFTKAPIAVCAARAGVKCHACARDATHANAVDAAFAGVAVEVPTCGNARAVFWLVEAGAAFAPHSTPAACKAAAAVRGGGFEVLVADALADAAQAGDLT